MLKMCDRETLGRVELPVLTHEPTQPPKAQKKTRKPRTKAVLTAAACAVTPTTAPHNPAVTHWGTFGVAFMLVLSAALNGFSNAQHAPAAWAGWLMGLAVPVIVLTLAKVAGEKYRAGQKWVGGLAGGSGVALLFLSVWHCANSIAVLTGSELALAVPLALAIDLGLVSCEIALVTEPRDHAE